MPIYEYCCDKCGKEFEELVFDDSTPACPYCGSSLTHKLMSSCCVRCGSDASSSGSGSTGAGSGGGCAGCAGGNCASCGH